MVVPPWLESLLRTTFFRVCRAHGDAGRGECNMYCLDCKGDSFCSYCHSSKHKEHKIIQGPVSKPKPAKLGVLHLCEIYARTLLDRCRFCSLGCKVVGIERNASFNNGALKERRSKEEEEEMRQGSQQDINPCTPPPPASNAR
ncbi:hypothetical protein V6N13_043039 [Hibiscus sabdariffa]|uniref:B box-type domain-containing protein n=1 Tax=Hibiscus sabdariffa TaxID=183260 RepID=A0ABR2G2V0_9ROSI